MTLSLRNLYRTGTTTVTSPMLDAAEVTTSSLADSASEDQDVVMHPVSLISKVEADQPCRIRAYATQAARQADAARDEATAPPGDLPILLDVVLDNTNLDYFIQEARVWVNLETPQLDSFYLNIENQSGATNPIIVTLHYSALIVPESSFTSRPTFIDETLPFTVKVSHHWKSIVATGSGDITLDDTITKNIRFTVWNNSGAAITLNPNGGVSTVAAGFSFPDKTGIGLEYRASTQTWFISGALS